MIATEFRRALLLFAILGAALTTAAAGVGQPPATAPVAVHAAPIDGWKAAADPTDIKGKPRGDIRLVIPIKHGAEVARSQTGSPFVAVADDDFSRQQNWFLADMRGGGFKPVVVAKPVIEDAVVSFGGEFVAGTSRGTGVGHEIGVWSLKTGQLAHKLAAPLDADVRALGFAAGGKVVGLQNKDGEPTLPVWDVKTGAVLYTISPGKLEGNVEPFQFAISPGGRFLVVLVNGQLHAYSTADGTDAGDAPLPPMDASSVFGPRHTVKALVYSADGGEVAAFCEVDVHPTKDRIIAWDMASGRATADVQMPQTRDDRWTQRNDIKFEDMPEGKGWRFNREILDRGTGLSVYTIPPAREHQEGLAIKALDGDHIFVVGQAEGGSGVPVATVTLPRLEMTKATAALQAGGKSIDAKLPPLSHGQWPTTQKSPASAPGAWALKPDLAKLPALGSAPILLKASPPFANEEVKPTRIMFSGTGGNSAAVSYSHGSGDQVRLTTIDRISLGGGSPATFDVPGPVDLMDLSGDGSQFVVRTQEDRIDIYTSSGAAPVKPFVGFRPYEQAPAAPGAQPSSEQQDARKVAFAAMLDGTHLLTTSKDGMVVLWSVPGCQGLWSMQTDANIAPWLSPGRKQLAISNNDSTVFLDALTGAPLATLAPMVSGNIELSISPDGGRFARYERNSGYLTVVGLATGQTLSECTIKSNGAGIYWCGPSHLLLSSTALVDLELRQVVWSFFPSFCPSVGQPDGRYWCAAQDQRRQTQMLTPFTLPQPEAAKLVAGLNKDEAIVVKPGAKVTLEVNILGDEARQKDVTQIMTQKLTELGMSVAPDQPLHLQATLTQVGSKQEKYRKGNEEEIINIPQFELKIAFVKDGETIWGGPAKFYGWRPGMFVMIPAGKTLQQMEDEANAKVGQFHFQNCRLPKYAAKQIQPPTESMFTAAGIVPTKFKSHP